MVVLVHGFDSYGLKKYSLNQSDLAIGVGL